MPMPRRWSLWLSLALALLAGLVAAPSTARAEIKAGDRAAELVKVVDRTGKKLALSRLRDRVVVLTFGASWCAPCKSELPRYEKLAAAYAARGAKVTFIAVNIDGERAKGDAFVKQAGLKHVVAGFDTGKSTVEAYDPPKMPSTFVIRKGIVRQVHAGYAAGDDKVVAAIVDRELGKL